MLAHLRIDDAAGESESRGGPTRDDVDDISLDCIFDVLRNRRRRNVIRHLAEADDDVPFSTFVDRIAAMETGSGGVDSRTRKAVYTALYQSHLPKLAEAGIISHDRQSGPVSPGPNLETVVTHLQLIEATREDQDAPRGVARKGLDAIKAAIGLAPEASVHVDEATGD